MRIGNLAEATGTAVETIRFYEREGLLRARCPESQGITDCGILNALDTAAGPGGRRAKRRHVHGAH